MQLIRSIYYLFFGLIAKFLLQSVLSSWEQNICFYNDLTPKSSDKISENNDNYLRLKNKIEFRKKIFYAFGNILGWLRSWIGYIGKGRSRYAYLNYIQKALPETDPRNAKKILSGFWKNHQKNFLEFFLLEKLSPANLDLFVKFEGLQYLDQALEKNKGVVLPVPHFGNERLLHVALAIKGYSVKVISSRYEEASKIVQKIRLSGTMKQHYMGYPDEYPRWMYKCLKDGEILQISPTADGGKRGLWVEFLHHKVLINTTPLRLSFATGAVVIPAFDIRDDDNYHQIHFLPPIPLENLESREEAIAEGAKKLMKIIETQIKNYPDQFFWTWLAMRHEESLKAGIVA